MSNGKQRYLAALTKKTATVHRRGGFRSAARRPRSEDAGLAVEQRAGRKRDVEEVQFARAELRALLRGLEEAVALARGDDAVRQRLELADVVLAAERRAPSGCALATAISSSIVVPSFMTTSTRPPKASSFGSREW